MVARRGERNVTEGLPRLTRRVYGRSSLLRYIGRASLCDPRGSTAMLIDALKLLLFPALMAFAASSDLLTMTISNRLSIALAGGFVVLTIASGMALPAIGWHLAAGLLVLAASFVLFTQGWI